MAKNLKINIKNTQLAGVLQLNKIKKAAHEEKQKRDELKESKELSPAPPVIEPIVEPAEPVQVKEVKEIKEPAPKIEPRESLQRPSFPPRTFPPRETPRQPLSAKPKETTAPKKEATPPPLAPKPPVRDFRDFKTFKRPEGNRSFDSRDRQGLRDEDDGWRKKRSLNRGKSREELEAISRPKTLKVRLPIAIKDLASEMKLKASELISKLFMQGLPLTLNDILIDETVVQLLGHEFGCEITIDTSEAERIRITDKSIKEEILETSPSLLTSRPPVVTFMGHVDHGKTSLIDAIRQSNVVAGEAGAITQHIGAFKCRTLVGEVTILDTPGHEAFSQMRERGAEVTDLVVLVIAGDDGIKAQTLEAIAQAKEAGVPILVAANKCDKPGFNLEEVYRGLAEQDLLPEAWGGSIITVPCSAVTKEGINQLLEMIVLQSEVLELKANTSSRARGTVIESEMHKGLGAVATVLVQNGTLRVGDALVFNTEWGRVKTMRDEHEKDISIATPSTPVKITGLSSLPEAGSEFIVVKDEKEARELSDKRIEGNTIAQLQSTKRKGIEALMQEKTAVEKKVLNVILRADVQGSLEALKNSLLKIKSEKVDLNIVYAGVGEIGESDVERASASKAIILGFHTKVEAHAESLIREKKVVVKLHDIIYHAIDDVKLLMVSLLDKLAREDDIGSALVKMTFKSSHLGIIAGCIVTDGVIKRNAHIRLMRGKELIWKGPIASLKRLKEDVREVAKGLECGIFLNNCNEIKEGDLIQAFEVSYLEQTL